MANFIYVFTADDRDKLLAMQYELLADNEAEHIYVFLNKECQSFAARNIKFVLSDTLTF